MLPIDTKDNTGVVQLRVRSSRLFSEGSIKKCQQANCLLFLMQNNKNLSLIKHSLQECVNYT